LFHLNQRTSDETRAVLIDAARWQACEVTELPPREGPLVCGLDLGGSASMSAWANYWPQTGRLESYGAFASQPGLLERGRSDAVGERYLEMHRRGELITLGGQVVPVHEFIAAMLAKLDGYSVGTIVCDRFRQAVFDGRVRAKASLLLRSALGDAVTVIDPAGNAKLAKGRSTGRIDPAAASVLAIAEGARLVGRAAKKPARMVWA
jgi:phage terminase large subunit-like protein